MSKEECQVARRPKRKFNNMGGLKNVKSSNERAKGITSNDNDALHPLERMKHSKRETATQNPLPKKPKAEPMQKQIIERYADYFKSKASPYFSGNFNVTASAFSDGTIIAFSQNDKVKYPLKFQEVRSFEEASSSLNFDINNFVAPSDIETVLPVKGTSFFYAENKIFVLKENNPDEFTPASVKEDLEKIVTDFENVPA